MTSVGAIPTGMARVPATVRDTVAVGTLVLGCLGATLGAAKGALTGVASAETVGVGVYWRAFAEAESDAMSGSGP